MAIADITEAIRLAKILVFVIPHQFIGGVCEQIKSYVTEGTIGISLIKVNPSLLLPSLNLRLLSFSYPNYNLFNSSSSSQGSDTLLFSSGY